jgi:hypothetical protein
VNDRVIEKLTFSVLDLDPSKRSSVEPGNVFVAVAMNNELINKKTTHQKNHDGKNTHWSSR